VNRKSEIGNRKSAIRWGSLHNKIIAWFFVPTMIILVVVAVVIFYAYQNVTEDLVIGRNRELTRLSASKLATELTEFTDLLTNLARKAAIYQGDPAARREALKTARNRLAVFDGGALILDAFGRVVAAEPVAVKILGQNWSDRPFYRQIMHNQRLHSPAPVFSDIVRDGPDSTEVIVVAVPISDEYGEFSGVMAGMFRLGETTVNAFYDSIVKLRLGEGRSIYLVDGNGRVIYHSDTSRIGNDLWEQAVVQQVLNGEADALRTHSLDGQDIVAGFSPVRGTPWGLITEENWNVLMRSSQSYGRFLLLLLALGVIVPALLVTIGVRRITKPITDLIVAAQEVAGGNFGQTITAQTGDEIEELAEQFNLMSAQLRESYADLERKVADRTKELAALYAIAAVASQSLDLDEVLNDVLDKTLQVMETEAGGIYLLDEETELLTMAAHRGFSPEFVKEIDRLQVGEGFSGHVVQSCQPLVVRDVSTDSRLTRTAVREEGLRSVAIVPLCSQRMALGTLFAATRGYREFTDQDIQLLTSIGHQIGVAIGNARLFQAEQRRAEQFRVIGEVGSRITSILAVNELLNQMARLIQQTFDYYHVGIGLVVGDEVIYRVGAGTLWDDPRFQFEPARLKVGAEGITGWVAATGKPLLVPDVSQEPRYVWMQGSETRSELTVPIKAKGEIIGVLDVQSDRLNAFDESDLVVLQSLANQAAVAIENARLFAERERRLDEMAVLNEVGQAISSTLPPSFPHPPNFGGPGGRGGEEGGDLLDLIYHQVGRVMDATNLYIAFYDRDEDWVSFPLYVEGGQVRRHAGGRKAGQGLTEHIIRTRQPLLLPDDVAGRMQQLGIEAIGAPARSWLGVPMIAGDEVLGVIAVQSHTTENVYDEGHLNLLPTIAAQAAIAIENARLYEQARQLAVMEERQRLARELHDAVTQTLFSASLIAEALPSLWESDQDEGRQLLQDLRQLSRGALAEMRTLLMELRPTALADSHLRDLLYQLGEAVTGRTGVPVTVTVEGRVDLPADVHVALYRIAQEALNNVVKHARASQVTVSLRCYPPFPPDIGWEQRGGAVELLIRDDGRGFDVDDVEPGELGLGIMRERAQAIGASLNIESQPGHGTQVAVVWEGKNGEWKVENGQPTTNDQ